jgi:hypothetical protein
MVPDPDPAPAPAQDPYPGPRLVDDDPQRSALEQPPHAVFPFPFPLDRPDPPCLRARRLYPKEAEAGVGVHLLQQPTGWHNSGKGSE